MLLLTVLALIAGFLKEILKELHSVAAAQPALFIQVAVSQTTYVCLTLIQMLTSLAMLQAEAEAHQVSLFATITAIILAHVVRGTASVTVLIW